MSSSDSDGGGPAVICRPSTAFSIAQFVLINYAAHCATVKSRPGEPTLSAAAAALSAFLFPAFGIIRAWDGIIRHSRFTKGTALQKAGRAGALCMVVRDLGWRPEDGDFHRKPFRCRRRREYGPYLCHSSFVLLTYMLLTLRKAQYMVAAHTSHHGASNR